MRSYSLQLEKCTGGRACAHCGNTFEQLVRALGKDRKGASRPVPCRSSVSGDQAICTLVRSRSDVQPGWVYKPTSNPSVFGASVFRKREDAAVGNTRTTWEQVQIAAARQELNARQRARFEKHRESIENAFHAHDEAVNAGDELAQKEALKRVEEAERKIARIRTKGLTAIKTGIASITNPAIKRNVKSRLIDPDGSRFEALQRAAIRQPQAGAFPAMAGSAHADKDGRLLVTPGDAVILATDHLGRVTGLQTMTDPRRGAAGKYEFAGAGQIDQVDGMTPNHLAVELANGKLDKASLFTSSALIPMLEQGTGSSVFAVDGAAKALFTGINTGYLTLGSVGANHGRTTEQIKACLDEVVRTTGKQPTLFIALDAADVCNPSGMVAQLIDLYHSLCRDCYDVCFLWWNQRKKDSADIDELVHQNELLGSHHSPASFSRLTPREVLELQPPEARQLSDRQLLAKSRSGAHLLPADEVDNLPLEVPYETNPQTDIWIDEVSRESIAAAVNGAVKKGFSAGLLLLETGVGKTYSMVAIQPTDISGCSRTILTSPLALTVHAEYAQRQPDLVAVRGKDSGRSLLEDGRIVRSDDPLDAQQVLAPNCSQGLTISYLRGANADKVASERCRGCRDRPKCMTTPGWYLADREEAKLAQRIICDPSSLQAEHDIWDANGVPFVKHAPTKPGTLVQLDESATVRWGQTITVSWDEMRATFRQVERHLCQSAKQVMENLMSLPKPKGYDATVADQLRSALLKGTKLSAVNFTRAVEVELACIRSDNRSIQLRKAWLTQLSRFLHQTAGAAYGALTASGLQFTEKNTVVSQALESGGVLFTLCADATGSRRELEQRLGRRVAIIRQRVKPKPAGHSRIQFVGLGVGTGYGRSVLTRWLMRKARHELPRFLGMDQEQADLAIAYIDTKKAIQQDYDPEQRTTAYRAGSRGINSMADVAALNLNGTPRKNLLGLAADWAVLTGEHLHPGDSVPVCRRISSDIPPSEGSWVSFELGHQNQAFRQWCAAELEAEFVQAAGRGRFNRREDDEKTWVISFTDSSQPWDNQVLKIDDLLGPGTAAEMRRLGDVQTIRAAWNALPRSQRNAHQLADRLEVPAELLVDRCSFEDCTNEPFFAAVMRIAARQIGRQHKGDANLVDLGRQTKPLMSNIEKSIAIPTARS